MLLEQLRPGGIMALPVNQIDKAQQLIKIEKPEDDPSYSELRDVLFVPWPGAARRYRALTDRAVVSRWGLKA